MNPGHDEMRPAHLPLSASPCAEQEPDRPQRWHSRVLLGERKEVEIEHDGMVYRLRLTSLGKLILTK